MTAISFFSALMYNLKQSGDFMNFLRRTWAEIDTKALKHNFQIIKSKSGGAKIMAVVKANAYGHDYRIVSPVLDKCGADAFAVSNIDEAIELRQIGINKEILILGYPPCTYRGACHYQGIKPPNCNNESC